MVKNLMEKKQAGFFFIVLSLFSMLMLPIQARSAVDALDNPALMSNKASRALLLNVVRAGSRLIAVGEHGIIVYSDDQGANWIQAQVPVSVTLTATFFPHQLIGWAVGHDGVILHSTTGGVNWTKQFDGNQANSLMQTEAQNRLDQANSLLSKAQASGKVAAQRAVADAENALAEVEAGMKFGPSRPLLGVWFNDDKEGFVVGSYGQIFHTADAGSHWESLALRIINPEGLHYNAIGSTPSGALVIAGEAGKVYRSTDHGATWQNLDTGYQGQLFGVLGIYVGKGVEKLLAFGFGGHIFQSDAQGKHWTELASVTRKNLVAGTILKDGSIQLVGQDGSILRSDQQVTEFHLVQPGSGLSIAGAVQSAAGNKLIMVGSGGLHAISSAIEPSDNNAAHPEKVNP